MKIKGKVYCFFEQSGTFKNEFRKLGYDAQDFDIQDEFGQTDHVMDLFTEIEKSYDGEASVFDNITPNDLIMAFFPCLYFCDAKTLFFRGEHIAQKSWSLEKIMRYNIMQSKERDRYFDLLMKLVCVSTIKSIRIIIENPYNTSGMTYLENNFIKPTIVDRNRMMRGDYYIKPTAYWFINCEPTNGRSIQMNKEKRVIMKARGASHAGICSTERSAISPDYARNFIYDFILGKEQKGLTEPSLFKKNK